MCKKGSVCEGVTRGWKSVRWEWGQGKVRKIRRYLSGNESEVSIRTGRTAGSGWLWGGCVCRQRILRTREQSKRKEKFVEQWRQTWLGGERCGSRFLRPRWPCTCMCQCRRTRSGRCAGCRLRPVACEGWTARWSQSRLFPRRAWKNTHVIKVHAQ